ncbi:ATP-grasp domain-containing protein [Schinkia sp. CFF1]
MKSIIFLGVNKSGSSREAVRAANELGYHTIVFTNQVKQIHQRREYPDVHQLILLDLSNLEELRAQIKILQQRGSKVVAIVSFVANYVYTASLLADEFCKNNIVSTEAVSIMVNKEKTREFFAKESFTPKFLLVKSDDELPVELESQGFKFPIVIKGAESTGSKDVLFAKNNNELQEGGAVLKKKYPEESILIEEYIDGEQYLVEVLVTNGQILIAAIIKQEITKGKRFIVTGYSVLAEVDSKLEEGLLKVIDSIVTNTKLQNGAFHLELRLRKDGWKLIEINPRISGGAMNRMIEAAFGYSLVKETLKMLLGDVPTLIKETNQFVFTKYIILDENGILERVTGKKRAMAIPGVVEVFIKPRRGTFLTSPPLSMGHRYAYIIAKGDTLEEAQKVAKKAAKEIKFHLKEE